MKTYILTYKDKQGRQLCKLYSRFGEAESMEKFLRKFSMVSDVQFFSADEIYGEQNV